jgi:hypothetical protein
MNVIYAALLCAFVLAAYIGEHGHRGAAQAIAIGVLVAALVIRSRLKRQ